jgi:hypothetical protein
MGIPAHGIKAYGGAEVQLHSFLALTLDGVQFKDRWKREYFETSDGSDLTHQL